MSRKERRAACDSPAPEHKSARGGARPNAGRPPKPIDLAEVEKLASCGATDEEIGYRFDLERSAVTRRRQNDPEFAEVMERGKAKGRISLRRKQFELAMKGNVVMLIWLGKNLLQQKDRIDGNLAIQTLSIRDCPMSNWRRTSPMRRPADCFRRVRKAPEETADKTRYPPLLETTMDVDPEANNLKLTLAAHPVIVPVGGSLHRKRAHSSRTALTITMWTR